MSRRQPRTSPCADDRPWWAEVQHLRAAAERRQARERLEARRAARRRPPEPSPDPVEGAPAWADPAPPSGRAQRTTPPAPPAAPSEGPPRALRGATAPRVGPGGRLEASPRVGPRERLERSPRGARGDRTRPAHRSLRLVEERPDRIAMWVPVLGFFLSLVAAASSIGPR